ncbi:hypothetical protein AMS68_000682 [Peltaster fructicola]|uniref:Uncharacterized protein n=1 Tax=Peltaster fructicola TaxID=286661 RepID=A0A6H0XKL2_9PEZI|nr:hypothetical protein AMS68_000682 [Peltaster fructicola]
MFKSPILNLHTGSPQGTVVAGARFPGLSTGIDIVMGDPSSAAPERCSRLERTSLSKGSWGFQSVGTGRVYEWRRTHRKELGASRYSNDDFKLVDSADHDRVLATYIKDSFYGGSDVAHMDFFVELGQDLELQAITSILAIEEKSRRQHDAGRVGAISAAGA